MDKKYLYLGAVMTLVVILTVIKPIDFSTEGNKTLTAERALKQPEQTGAAVKEIRQDNNVGRLINTETFLPRVNIENGIIKDTFSLPDRDNEFIKDNVADLADILDIANPDERGVLESVAQRHAANAKKLADNYYKLVNEVSELVSLEIKEGELSDEDRARLESIDAALLLSAEESARNAIASQDEIRNLLSMDQQQSLMKYEKAKIVAFRSEATSVILKSFLDGFEGSLSAEQINFIDKIPMNVAGQVAIENYNFGFSLSMSNDSISKINVGAGFPSTLIDEAFMQLRNTLTPDQIVSTKIDDRLYPSKI